MSIKAKPMEVTVRILSFRTDRYGQTVQTQIRLLLEESSLIRVYTVCNSVCIFWMHYSTVKPSCSNFSVIKANVLGVRIFRSFTVTSLKIHLLCSLSIEPPSDKTNILTCAPSKDSDQPGHLSSLIRVFAVRSMGSWGPKLSSCGQRRLWSDWADDQADLSLHWAHMPFCWFCHEAAQLKFKGGSKCSSKFNILHVRVVPKKSKKFRHPK